MDYKSHIKTLINTEFFYPIGAHVKSVELKNMDVFIDRKKLVFDKCNILRGDKKSGKTFLTTLIFDACTRGKTMLEDFLPETEEFKDSSVKIVFNSPDRWMYTFPENSVYDDMDDHYIGDIDDRWDYYSKRQDICLLFDEPDLLYHEKEQDGFLNYLKSIEAQVIITTKLDQTIHYPKEYNIINL